MARVQSESPDGSTGGGAKSDVYDWLSDHRLCLLSAVKTERAAGDGGGSGGPSATPAGRVSLLRTGEPTTGAPSKPFTADASLQGKTFQRYGRICPLIGYSWFCISYWFWEIHYACWYYCTPEVLSLSILSICPCNIIVCNSHSCKLFYFPLLIYFKAAVSACFYARLSCLHCQALAAYLVFLD